MPGPVAEVSSDAELQALCSSHSGLTALLLWAPWHPPSVQLTKVFEAISSEQKTVHFGKVNTDVCGTIATTMGADQVPFVIFLDPKGKKIDSFAGFDPPKLVEKVKMLAARPVDAVSSGVSPGSEDLNDKLKRLINFSPVMLFMKGNKHEPCCKFSKQAVAMLEKYEAEYSTFDILSDEDVRAGLKEYSNWKTYPQLYIHGELIGGIDIMKEMDEDGSFKEVLVIETPEGGNIPLEDRLKALINKGEVTLFMKGDPDQPKCGFSKKMVELLKEQNITFETFDILQDNEVREGLKSYSNWRTYPQLYSHGKLIGGLDIVKELVDEGALFEELGLEQKANL